MEVIKTFSENMIGLVKFVFRENYKLHIVFCPETGDIQKKERKFRDRVTLAAATQRGHCVVKYHQGLCVYYILISVAHLPGTLQTLLPILQCNHEKRVCI